MRRSLLLLPLAAALLVTACTGHTQRSATRPVPGASTALAIGAAANGCAGQPPVSSLPVWARSGFSPPDVAMPHVMGAAGNIVAVLWSPRSALHSPPLPNVNNKILWVSKVPLNRPVALVIRATLAGSTRTATVTLPDGPGPSYVDLPAPGCWTLHLSWGGHTDQLLLRYTG